MILDWLVLNAEKSSYHDGSHYAGDSDLWMACLKLKIFDFIVDFSFEKIRAFSFYASYRTARSLANVLCPVIYRLFCDFNFCPVDL